MSKLFQITYEAKVKRVAVLMAKTEEDAVKKFNAGHGAIEKEINMSEVTIVKNEELKDEDE